MKGALRFWGNVISAALLSGVVFMTYMFFSGGMCRAALEFADACTLQSRWQAMVLNWQSALMFLPIALAVGAVIGIRITRRERKEKAK